MTPYEHELQSQVIAAARLGGWMIYHTHDSRRSQAGFPDLVLVRGGVCLFVELKRTARTKPRPPQVEWIEALAKVETVEAFFCAGEQQTDRLIRRLTQRSKPARQPQDPPSAGGSGGAG